MNRNREFMNALMDEMLAFGVPIEGLHTETGPGVYEVAIAFGEALEQADRSILFKTGAKEIGARFGIMPSFMAKWNAKLPGCSGHIHQSLKDGKHGKTNLFYDAKSERRMSPLFESYVAGQVRLPAGVRADVLRRRSTATSAWSTASGRPSSRPGESTTGRRAFASSPAARRRPGSRRAVPAPTSIRTWRWRRWSPPACTASRRA